MFLERWLPPSLLAKAISFVFPQKKVSKTNHEKFPGIRDYVGITHPTGNTTRVDIDLVGEVTHGNTNFQLMKVRQGVPEKSASSILPGLRSEVKVTLECFVLDPCTCWRLSLGIEISRIKHSLSLCTSERSPVVFPYTKSLR